MAVLTLFSAIGAFFYPPLFLIVKEYFLWLFAVTMFAVGLVLPIEEAKAAMKDPVSILIGVASQYTIMPLLGFAAAWILMELGYDVSCASDGSETIGLYQDAARIGQPFDAVIMDLTIPGGMGGKETIRQLLSIDPQATAIVSSGYSNDPIMSDFEKYGFCGVATKPYTIEKLSWVLHDVLADAKERD